MHDFSKIYLNGETGLAVYGPVGFAWLFVAQPANWLRL